MLWYDPLSRFNLASAPDWRIRDLLKSLTDQVKGWNPSSAAERDKVLQFLRLLPSTLRESVLPGVERRLHQWDPSMSSMPKTIDYELNIDHNRNLTINLPGRPCQLFTFKNGKRCERVSVNSRVGRILRVAALGEEAPKDATDDDLSRARRAVKETCLEQISLFSCNSILSFSRSLSLSPELARIRL